MLYCGGIDIRFCHQLIGLGHLEKSRLVFEKLKRRQKDEHKDFRTRMR